MRKSELTNGTKILVVNIKHFVSIGVFATALRNEFYDSISPELENIIHDDVPQWTYGGEKFEPKLDELLKNSTFFENLTKIEAEEMLKLNLKYHGKEGSIDTTLYEASYERGEALNRCYNIAREWVEKKFPYLSNKKAPTSSEGA